MEDSQSNDDTPDLELLTRKIAKCDRLLKRLGRNHKDTYKLTAKRAEYIAELGEIAYRAALASVALDLESSPKGVTDKRLDPSKVMMMNHNLGDSLAVFDYSLPTVPDGQVNQENEEEQENVSESTDIPPQEELSAKEEQQAQKEKSTELTLLSTTLNASSSQEVLTEQEGSTLETPLVDEQGEDNDAPLQVDSPDLDSEGEYASEPVSTNILLQSLPDADESVDEIEEEEEEVEIPNTSSYNNVSNEQSRQVVDDDIVADIDSPADAEPNEGAAEELVEENDEEPVLAPFERPNSMVSQVQETPAQTKKTVSEQEEDASESKSITDEIATGELSPLPKMKQSVFPAKEEEFNGDGSVSKLRAMFDSPHSSGDKPRRSWKPRKIIAEVPPVNLDDDNDEPNASGKSQTAPRTKVTHPMVNADQEAPMTKSVHDIDSKVVALVSLFPESLYDHLPKQNRALTILKGNKIDFVYVDGSNPEEKDRRAELFDISGRRGIYPQLFVRNATSGRLQFFADFNKIELLNDCQSLVGAIANAGLVDD